MSALPLRWLVPWPEAFLGPLPAANLLDQVLVQDLTVEGVPGGWRVRAELVASDPAGAVLGLPGWNDFGLVLRELSRIEVVLGATNAIRIELGTCAVRLPRHAFQPVRHSNGVPDTDASGDWIPETVAAEVVMGWPASGGVRQHALTLAIDDLGRFELTTAGPAGLPVPAASLTPTLVSAAGVVISAANLSFSFSFSRENPGLAADAAAIHLPDRVFGGFVPPDFAFRDVRVGPRGFSGSVDMTWPLRFDAARGYFYDVAGEPAATLFGMNGGVTSFTMALRENTLESSAISGGLSIPYFDQSVDVSVHIGADGDFALALTAASADGVTLTREELLALELRSLAVRREGTFAELVLSGGVRPLLMASDGLDWPKLSVEELSIDSTGRFRVREAWLDINDLATLDLWGFQFELRRLGVGYDEDRDRLWLDLSGGLRLIEQVPIGVDVEGFRISWPRLALEGVPTPLTLEHVQQLTSQVEVKFDGVYLFYGVPGLVEFEGLIRFIKEEQAVAFAGDIAVRVPAAGLAAEAGLLIGIDMAPPPYPFLYVYFGVELPAGIPLAQSGLALKGALGLFGINVAPDRTPEQNWYYDWYKRGPVAGAHPTNKWKRERDALALGVGVTITTADGFVKGTRGLLLAVLPGPIVIIEGRALLLDGLTPGEPPLRALAVFDGREQTAQFNLDAEAELVEGMLSASGTVEALFDFADLTNWHLYLGQDEPPDRRVRANVLDLLKADSYLMLDMPGPATLRSRMGVFAEFDPQIPDFGPLTVDLSASIHGLGVVTIEPEQFSGDVALSARLRLSAFGFEMGLSASAAMLAEGPKPFQVNALVEVEADLPDPLEDFEAQLEFDWQAPQLEVPELLSPLTGVSLESRFAAAGTPLAVQALSAVGDERAVAVQSPVVAADAKPLLTFRHETNQPPGAPFLRHPSPIKHFDVGSMRFEPEVALVEIYEHRRDRPWTGGSQDWTLIASSARSNGLTLGGVWLADADPQRPSSPPSRRLALWTDNPLIHTASGTQLSTRLGLGRATAQLPAEAVLDDFPDLMACGDTKVHAACVNFEGIALGPLPIDTPLRHRGVRLEPVENQGRLEIHHHGTHTCLAVPGYIHIGFPQAARRATLRLCMSPAGPPTDIRALVSASRAPRSAAERDAVRRNAGELGNRADYRACTIGVNCSITVSSSEWVVESDEQFDCIHILRMGAFSLSEVCWVPSDELTRVATMTRKCAANAQPPTPPGLLRSGAYYKVAVTSRIAGGLRSDAIPSATDSLVGALLVDLYESALSALDLLDAEKTFDAVAYFQTDGPPDALASYIGWTHPAADADRVFLDDDLAVRFRRAYLPALYPAPAFPLDLVVRGTDGRVVAGYETRWAAEAPATQFPDEEAWDVQRRDAGLPAADRAGDATLIGRRDAAAGGLAPNSRYELRVAGGGGGRLLGLEWDTDPGWAQQAGTLRRTGRSEALRGGDARWTDIDFAVEFRDAARRGAGVLVRCAPAAGQDSTADDGAYRVRVDSRSSTVHLERRGPAQPGPPSAWRSIASSRVALAQVDWTRLRVMVSGERVRAWIFDREVLDTTVAGFSPQAPPLRTGRVGLHAGAAGVEFRAARVRDPVLHSVRFTTSAFARFGDLVRSYSQSGPGQLQTLDADAAPDGGDVARMVIRQLARAEWDWQQALVSYRYDVLPDGRAALEAARLARREARAAADASFRAFAEQLSPLVYQPLQPFCQLFGVRGPASSRVVAFWLRAPESLDLRSTVLDEPANAGSAALGHVGRTTLRLERGAAQRQPFHTIQDADSRQVLLLPAGTGCPRGAYQLTFVYHRDHGDEAAPGHHRGDRPVERRQGGTAPDVETISWRT